MSKRVPTQYHLALHNQSTYKGLPLLNIAGGFVEEYLRQLHRTIGRSIQRFTKVFAVRVDLRFPQYYSPYGQKPISNQCLQLFIRALRYRLERYGIEKRRLGQRVHSVDFEYVWAREYGRESNKPHFHLLLLFSGNTFNTLGHFSNTQESLYNRIGESWGEVLGIHVAEGAKFVHFPENGQYLAGSTNSDQVAQIFYRSSYLAKIATKNFHDGFHVFGGSRV